MSGILRKGQKAFSSPFFLCEERTAVLSAELAELAEVPPKPVASVASPPLSLLIFLSPFFGVWGQTVRGEVSQHLCIRGP